MIKYECDMCHKIFKRKGVINCKIPRIINYKTVNEKIFFTKIKEEEIVGTRTTHLCDECAKKIAELISTIEEVHIIP